MNLYKTIAVGLVCTSAAAVSIAAMAMLPASAKDIMNGVGVVSILAIWAILRD